MLHLMKILKLILAMIRKENFDPSKNNVITNNETTNNENNNTDNLNTNKRKNLF